MAEVTTEKSFGPYKNQVEIWMGGTFEIGTRMDTTAAVIGRDPLSLNVIPPDDLPKGSLAVELGNTSRVETSRQQMRVERGPQGFFVQNLSHSIPMIVESGLKGRVDLGPGKKVELGKKVQDIGGLKMYWGKPGVLQGVLCHKLEADRLFDSTRGDWSIGFRFVR